ncbi:MULTISPECIES: ABC transporter ATP-binding protein [unclassified Ligilactobacillus]|uniref:ABC transporter ATP-binding protein n=1 Tax=unclassified Ligilactobacillus TaxID=2767920 RepID=UPI00385521FE
MIKLIRNRLPKKAIVGSFIFMLIQVITLLYLPTLTANIVNNGIARGNLHAIVRIGIIMLFFSLISVGAAAANAFFSAQGSQKLGQRLRSAVFRKVITSSRAEREHFGTSSLITRTTNDIMQIQNVVLMFLRLMMMAPLMLICASILAYAKSPTLTLIFIIVLPALALLVGIIVYFASPLFAAMQHKLDAVNRVFREGLTGVRVIRAFRQDQFEQERFDNANRDYTQNAVKVYSITALMLPIATLIMSSTNVLITYWGSRLIAVQATMVGNMMAFIAYATQILISFMWLAMVFVLVPRAQASAKRLNAVLDTTSSIVNPQHPTSIRDKVASLEFTAVQFTYPGGSAPALSGITFSAYAGDTVAVIGSTGSGKTSLVNLIPRFYAPTAGAIRVNGVPVQAISLHELRNQVALVPQKATLFSGTIRSNMLWGNKDATDEEIWHALTIAQAADFVRSLPDQLDATVDQEGANFSGGQRQRLAIARALVKDASIYVFDDSFSALDFQTDARLRAALKHDPRMKNRVVVIVGQRIATVADAAPIIVLDHGKMIGRGTHQELLATNTVYQDIVYSQLRKEDDHRDEKCSQ